MSTRKVRIAVVGLGFGSYWLDAYCRHPDVGHVGICDMNAQRLAQAGDANGIARRHTTLDEVIESGQYDAVHLFTGIPDHGQQTMSVLEAGLHCACAIPMAIKAGELAAIARAERRTGRNYMLMETECYSATYLYVKQLYDRGEFGALQFMRAFHYQNMDGWPPYWGGLPPMYYSFHGLGPVMALHGRRAIRVLALGSGTRHADMAAQYGNPFPVETAMFQFDGMDAICETTVCLYKMSRGFMGDRFAIYGDRMGFEPAQYAGEQPMFFDMQQGPLEPGKGRAVYGRRGAVPPLEELVVPASRYYVAGVEKERRFAPLVHEFVRSIVEGRPSAINARVAADWTMAALCAHESAMRNGEKVNVPDVLNDKGERE